MRRPRWAALVLCLALLVGVAGCLSAVPSSNESPAPSSSSASPGFREATNTPEPLAGRANCSEDLRVSFWGLSEPRLWEANEVRFVGDVPANASYLYVAYVDGAPRGVRAMSTDSGLHVDGGSVPIEGDLAGDHAVRIVVHRDADRDEAFDPQTDPPCYSEDRLLQTRYLVIDFDRYW